MPADNPNPSTPQRIVLIGFMGAGKSTAGAALAARIGWKFIDADQYLEQQTGLTVAQIFSTFGESAFREMEVQAIAELHQRQSVVLALGGGAIESAATRSLLNDSPGNWIVFLRAPFSVLLERCGEQPGAAVRPLLQQRDTLSARFHSRLQHYESAHLTVDTADLNPEAVVDQIVHALEDVSRSNSLTQKAIAT